MFNLQPGVHLKIKELTVLKQKLDGARVGVVTTLSHSDRRRSHSLTHLVRKIRGRALLH